MSKTAAAEFVSSDIPSSVLMADYHFYRSRCGDFLSAVYRSEAGSLVSIGTLLAFVIVSIGVPGA